MKTTIVIPEWLASIQAWIHYVPIIATVLLFVIIVWGVARIMRSDSNPIEWADLVSALAHNGKQRGSWDAIGKGGGVILCMALPFIYVFSSEMTALGLVMVMTPPLLYLGGVSAYSASLRAKQGTVETVSSVELDPTSPAVTMTQTRTQTPAPVETK